MLVINDALPADLVSRIAEDILRQKSDHFDVYNNQCEQKQQLKRKYHYDRPYIELVDFMYSGVMLELIRRALGLKEPVVVDESQYTTAFFIYSPGDYLQPHYDASIVNGKRKAAVALLYLSECVGGEFCLRSEQVKPKFNMLVVFSNIDRAYHSVSAVELGKRIVFTTSYFFSDDVARVEFTENYTRAHFFDCER